MDDSVRLMICGISFVLFCILQIIVISFKTAVEHFNDNDLDALRETHKRKADQIERYYSDEHLLVISSSFLRICCGFGIVLTGTYMVSFGLSSGSMPFPMIVAVVTLLIFVLAVAILCFGIPYRVSSKKGAQVAARFVGIYSVLHIIFTPLIALYDFVSKKISGLFGVDPKDELDDVTEDEIISMVNEGHEQGVLLASEAAMIQNIFEFGDKDAKDIMVHRKQIVALDGDMTFGEVLTFMQTSTYSRYPVYLQDLDNIIGVLHIKDALSYAQDQSVYPKKLRDLDELLHSAEFVPETHGLNTLFAKMQSKKKHMMLVVDEYGQTSGLISMEDILEEIVGNIQDEHDSEEQSIERVAPDFYIMDGSTTLEEASEVLGIDFPDDFETLNGFLIAHIDKIPEEHERFEVKYGGYLFKVQDVVGKMIRQIQVFADETNS